MFTRGDAAWFMTHLIKSIGSLELISLDFYYLTVIIYDIFLSTLLERTALFLNS